METGGVLTGESMPHKQSYACGHDGPRELGDAPDERRGIVPGRLVGNAGLPSSCSATWLSLLVALCSVVGPWLAVAEGALGLGAPLLLQW